MQTEILTYWVATVHLDLSPVEIEALTSREIADLARQRLGMGSLDFDGWCPA